MTMRRFEGAQEEGNGLENYETKELRGGYSNVMVTGLVHYLVINSYTKSQKRTPL
jgi:hypothetical protein